ncbi:hypothetical protein Tco_0485143 [Tanacetum coccineum]
MSARREEMNSAEIEQIVAQRVANAIEAIVAYETTLRMTHDLMDKVVCQGTTIARVLTTRGNGKNIQETTVCSNHLARGKMEREPTLLEPMK